MNRNVERKEAGVDLGGYFLKDHIWFFGAYDRVITNNDILPITGPRAGEEFPVKTTSNLYAGKLTFNVAQGTTIVGTLFSDPQVNEGVISLQLRQARTHFPTTAGAMSGVWTGRPG